MRKMTLLEMTQNILSAMNSDEVNSISDTVESQQVAEEIRTAFYDLYSNRQIPELQSLVTLETVGDATAPNRLRLPANVSNILWVKYFDWRNSRLKDVKYLTPEQFIDRRVEDMIDPDMDHLDLDIPLVNTSNILYDIKNNSAPMFYTIFDNDNTLVFDSYDADFEPWMTADRALAWGILNIDFELQDQYIPPIDANLFPQLLAEAKSAAFINVKEVANAKEEQRARRQLVRSQTRLHKGRDHRQGVFSGTDFSRKR